MHIDDYIRPSNHFIYSYVYFNLQVSLPLSYTEAVLNFNAVHGTASAMHILLITYMHTHKSIYPPYIQHQ